MGPQDRNASDQRTWQQEPGAVTRQMVDELRAVVERGRRRWKRLILLEAGSLAVTAPLAYLWLVFLLDNVFHLSVWGRVLANGVFVACLAWMVMRVARSWKRAHFTEDQVALAMEGRTQGRLENRLINALQLSRQDAVGDRAVAGAVVEENYRFLKRVHIEQSAASRPAMVRLVTALLLVVAGVAFWALGRDRFTSAAARLFLPFADIQPVYRTVLRVEPGDRTASPGEDVTVTVHVEGRVPTHLLLLINEAGNQSSRKLALEPGAMKAQYTFPSVRRTIDYAVRGGDFTTRYYQITVLTPLALKRLTAVCQYPQYTRLPERKVESATADMEALVGTRAALTFLLSKPAREAWMLLEDEPPAEPAAQGTGSPGPAQPPERIRLDRTGPAEFTGPFVFEATKSYWLEVRGEDGGVARTPAGRLCALPDEPPEALLTGVEAEAEVMVDALLALGVKARDDYGLEEVGVFFRTVRGAPGGLAGDGDDRGNGEWRPVSTWQPPDAAADFRADYALAPSMLDVAEGDRIEIAGRARDTDPRKAGLWTTGPGCTITVTSPGAELQLAYEQILRTEQDLRALIAGHEQLEQAASAWIGKFEPLSGLRWDDQKNLDALAQAVGEQARLQSELRSLAAAIARDMAPQAGETLRVAVAMLADTEMVRNIRILERVPTRDTPQDKRSVLSDSRLTVQRTARSLDEILERYVQFREDWELAHMTGFTEMLAKRQASMADASVSYAALSLHKVEGAQQKAISRRQEKVLELSNLAQKAFTGMATRGEQVGPLLTAAFEQAAAAFDGTGLKARMQEAAALLSEGAWARAEPPQRSAADSLASICLDLRKAQAAAAREALSALAELSASSVEAQREIQKLREGSSASLVELEQGLNLEETIRLVALAEQLKSKRDAAQQEALRKDISYEGMMGWLQTPMPAAVDPDTLTLAREAGEEGKTIPYAAPHESNPGRTVIQEKFTDLVGDLLEEAESLREDYMTYNVTASWGSADAGTVGKKTGEPLSGTGATSTTGNIKPPSDDVGGAARAGRLGGRSHGLAVGDEMVNRRGRDEAQDGQQQVPDQEGEMREVASSDPQLDHATGTGGKVIASDQTHFSTKDEGEWKDDIVDKLQALQEKELIVERKGKPLDPEVANMMRDLESGQAQVVERIKAIKKELDQLYLPTDHLDEIMAKLQHNFDRLKEKPDADVFRQQIELLDSLKGTVIVFSRPGSDFIQALQREQVVRGRILDEPAAATIPGYEDAVSRYYRKLLGLEEPLP